VKSDSVELARIYIDDKLLDPTKPVTVFVGDDAALQGKVNLDVKAVLESWRSREDEARLRGVRRGRPALRSTRSEDTERLTAEGRSRRAPRKGSREISLRPPPPARKPSSHRRAVN